MNGVFQLHGASKKIYLALLTGLILLNACDPETRKTVKQTAGIKPWIEGTHYVIVHSDEYEKAAGGVEVMEFFLYDRPSCYILMPQISLWEHDKPKYIQFVRVPAVFSTKDRPYARLYYTLLSLGKEKLHSQVYDSIYRSKNSLLGATGEATKRLQLKFAEDHGVSVEEFEKAYSSSVVDKEVARAERLTAAFNISDMPTMVINGKFAVSATSTDQYFLSIVMDIASSEK